MEKYTNLALSSVDGCEEEQVGQEEAERELQVERGAGVLDGFAQQEGEGCQEEAEQGEAQPHIGDHGQYGILLEDTKRGIYYSSSIGMFLMEHQMGFPVQLPKK